VSDDARQLLDAVIAAPDDETPRLVYADWLSEHGDPRGAFVRGQCGLARLGEAHPGWSALHAHTERLRRLDEARWVEPLASCFPSREVWETTTREFRRGFVEHLEAPYQAIDWRILTSLVRVTPLRSVAWRPSGEAPERVAEALEAAAEAGVREAVVLYSGGTLREDAFEEVDPDIAHTFTAFGLRSATVSPLTTARLATLLGPRLRSLTLGHTIIGDAGLQPLAASGRLAQVEHLDLRKNQLGPDGVRALVSKPSAKPLELHLRDNPEAASAIDLVLDWRPLRLLDLVGSVDREAIDRLLASDAILDLEQLALAPGQPWHFDLERARKLARLPFRRLTRLTLGLCRISAAGMAALAWSPALASLAMFRAFGCQIGDEGVIALAGSPYLTRLVRLDLNGNRLTDRALVALGTWPGLEHVVRLELGQNYDVTERGWRALIEAAHFQPTWLGVNYGLKNANPGLWSALEERFGADVVHEDGVRWPSLYPSPYPALDQL